MHLCLKVMIYLKQISKVYRYHNLEKHTMMATSYIQLEMMKQNLYLHHYLNLLTIEMYFFTPNAASPTAFKIPWSKESWSNYWQINARLSILFHKPIPIPPGRKKKTLSAPEALI